ncbi:MAG: RNA polymerase sigma factor [Bacteroidales bacterium]|nr:RNA polymerase sigma factor [Bacteroidales bacterium]
MYNNLSEQELIQACCKKDKLAEGELYSRYAAKIFTICKRYTGNIEEAQDLMQESLLQALNKLHTFNYKGEGSLYGWIKKIAINKAINLNTRHRWRMVPTDFRFNNSIPEPAPEEIDLIP